MRIILLLLMATVISVSLAKVNTSPYDAYAHDFSPDSLSTFLTLSLRADIELSLADSSFPSNVTLALDHAENALNLINDAYYFDDDIVYDTDFIGKYNEAQNSQNATIQALVVANLVDQILSEYGHAFEVGYDLTNMSNMNRAIRTMPSSDLAYSLHSTSSMNMTIPSDIVAEENQNYTEIVNMDNYQSAQKLSEGVYHFKDQLLQSTNNTSEDDVDIVEKNIYELKELINRRASPEIIMTLVHVKLHPNLQAAYGLKLRQ